MEINKIRILARHSGDMILRYVADVPLISIRSDLGLASPAAGARSGDDLKKLKAAVDKALRRVSACDATAARLTDLVVNPPGSQYFQNVKSSVVHVVLPLAGERSSCGWHVGASKLKASYAKRLASLVGIPWFMFCERCLCSERAAAQHAQANRVSFDPLSESE